MADPVDAAQTAVAKLKASGDAREMARALLALAATYGANSREEDALAAARSGIEALTPAFVARPGADDGTMNALVTAYLSFSRRTGRALDVALLAPIAAAQGSVMQAEDDAGEGNGDG